MTSPGPTRQPAAAHARPALHWHADRRFGGLRGSRGSTRGYGAAWPGAWAAWACAGGMAPHGSILAGAAQGIWA
jgi:hypothetical protein